MTLEEAKQILGTKAKNMTDGQIEDLVARFTYLADTWLDEYERKIFDGKTVAELGVATSER